MWCKNCNIETNEEKCPICGEKTVEDYPTEVYWCDNCRVPVMQEVNQADKGICQRCGKPMKYLAADIRPVFPEERLLIEILLKKKPHQWINESVWASNNRYYINGKSVTVWVMTELDVGVVLTITREHSFFQEFICQSKQRHGGIFS